MRNPLYLFTPKSLTDAAVIDWEFDLNPAFVSIGSNRTLDITGPISGHPTFGSLTVTHTVAGTTLTLPGDDTGVVWATGLNERTWLEFLWTGEEYIWKSNVAGTGTPGENKTPIVFDALENVTQNGTQWTGTGSSGTLSGLAVRTTPLLSGDFKIRFQVPDLAVNTVCLLGVAESANGLFTNMRAGAYIDSATESYQLKKVDTGSVSTVDAAAQSAGLFLEIRRVGTTIKLYTSPDESTWTEKATYGYSSAVDLYAVANIDGAHTLYNPVIVT